MTLSPSGSARTPASLMLFAILLTMVSASLFTGSHGIVRYMRASIHPFEIAFFSNFFSFVFYIPWILRNGPRAMRTSKFHVHFLRSFFNAGSITIWYVALSLTPLADATALGLAAPLFVVLGAALFLGERVGPRRWAALGVGLVGALIILRPGFGAISFGLALVLVSNVLGSTSKLIAKHLSQFDSPVVIGAYVAMLQTPLTFILACFVWSWPTPTQLLWLFGVGMLAASAHITMVWAFRWADASFLEPFFLSRLIWAALIGYIVFAEWPDLLTWTGAIVIATATTYVARREYLQAAGNRAYVPPVVD